MIARTTPAVFPNDKWHLKDRAIRHHVNFWGCAQAFEETTLEQHDGREYIVIRHGDHVMSVYRIRNDGAVRRLHRWPSFVR
jgi:hypothetical protein